MIAHLKGVIREKSAGRLVVDVSGVGYEVLIPFSTYYELGEIGETVSLRIYTHVKENALKLYGFRTSKEKKLFTQLIQVSGIGPKLGVTILSGLPVDEFVQAVMDGEVVKLNRIPGVGKKTAERLVVEMKDKVVELFPEVEEAKKEGVPGFLQADVVSALVNLGYPKNTAEKAVAKALEEGHTDRFEELLRKSLRRIRA
ncbi:Holliday junction branch migration protein RuvA [Acidobacteria bacterium AH-259-L09]|nr:Holliday junction branch migration protein RuvA [Acidobacteria bacterium AH-259-L09]